MLPGSRNWEDASLRSAGGGTGTDTSRRPRLESRTPPSASLEACSQVFPPPLMCCHRITVPLCLPPSPALRTSCLSSGCLEMMGAGAQDERSSLVLTEWETRVEPAALLSRTVLCGQSRGLSEIQKQRNVFGLVSDLGVFLAYLPPPPRNCRLLSFVFVSLRMQRRDLTRS